VALICSGSNINYNPRLGAAWNNQVSIRSSGCHYLARSPLNIVGSHAFHKAHLCYGPFPNSSIDINCIGPGSGPLNSPDAVTGTVRFTRVQILCGSPVNSVAGYLPGFWGPLVNAPLGGSSHESNMLLIDGSGELEGHQLIMLATSSGTGAATTLGYHTQIAIDITAWP